MHPQPIKAGVEVDLESSGCAISSPKLAEIGEVVVYEEPIALAELSAAIASTPKAILFKDAGPDHLEMVAAVSGSRRRLAAAFGVDERRDRA